MKDQLAKYGVLVFGLILGLGFAFGPMMSYMDGNTQRTQQGQNAEDYNLELPEQDYTEEGFNRGLNELATIADRESIVFVTALYETEEQYNELSNIRDLQEEFEGRLYIEMINAEEQHSQLITDMGLSNFPTVLVVGDNPSNRYLVIEDDISQQRVAQAICDAIADFGSVASYCINL